MPLLASFRARRQRVRAAAFAGALGVAAVPAIVSAQPTPPQPPYLPPGQPASNEWEPPPYQDPTPEPSPPIIKNVIPILRISPGVGIHFDPIGKARPAFDLDVIAGIGLAFKRSHTQIPDLAFELGYSFSSQAEMGGHLFAIGATPHLRLGNLVSIGLAPKLVLGRTPQGFAIGMRNMLVLPILKGLFQVEAGHQWLNVEGQNQHEMRILAGIDLSHVLFAAVLGSVIAR
ncbi:Hypothetical protein A7982_06527 [Minicystis rosea]|nr:Hypothetical protein A7982_06527 [Minicystis rosea]